MQLVKVKSVTQSSMYAHINPFTGSSPVEEQFLLVSRLAPVTTPFLLGEVSMTAG